MNSMNSAEAKKLFTALVRARKFDEKVSQLYPEQEMKCPVHLSLGQEGSAAGVCAALRKGDYMFSTHRCHAHTVAKGASIKKLFAELYGKVTGCARGKGGSMHLLAPEVGALGASAIVGGSLPLALGTALAVKMKKEDKVTVAFLGDGGIEQGSFHEVMNFSSLHKLPLVIIVENNGLATITPLNKRQANLNLWKHAEAYNVPGFKVDGNYPEKVYRIAKQAVVRARKSEGPSLIEVTCFRWRGHVGEGTDYHLGFRSKEEVAAAMRNDPVKNFHHWATRQRLISEEEAESIVEKVEDEIEVGVKFAKESSYPDRSELYLHV